MLRLAQSTKLAFLPTLSLTTDYISSPFLHCSSILFLLKILANIHDRNVEIISVLVWMVLAQNKDTIVPKQSLFCGSGVPWFDRNTGYCSRQQSTRLLRRPLYGFQPANGFLRRRKIIGQGLVIIYQGGWGGVIQNFKE